MFPFGITEVQYFRMQYSYAMVCFANDDWIQFQLADDGSREWRWYARRQGGGSIMLSSVNARARGV